MALREFFHAGHLGLSRAGKIAPWRRIIWFILTVHEASRPVALSGYGSIAHEAKPNGLLTRGPRGSKSSSKSGRKGNDIVSKYKFNKYLSGNKTKEKPAKFAT